MILSDRDIKKIILENKAVYVKNGGKPLSFDLQLGSASFDLRLDNKFIIFERYSMGVIDILDQKKRYEKYMKKIRVSRKDGFILHPNEFALGSTLEFVRVPNNLVARLEGRSSYGRLGLMIHATAGYIDPGFEGQITLELHNVGKHPIKLYPQERICHLAFETLTNDVEKIYSKKKDNKYMKQIGAVKSRIHLEKRV